MNVPLAPIGKLVGDPSSGVTTAARRPPQRGAVDDRHRGPSLAGRDPIDDRQHRVLGGVAAAPGRPCRARLEPSFAVEVAEDVAQQPPALRAQQAGAAHVGPDRPVRAARRIGDAGPGHDLGRAREQPVRRLLEGHLAVDHGTGRRDAGARGGEHEHDGEDGASHPHQLWALWTWLENTPDE